MTREAKAAWARRRRRLMAYGRWEPTQQLDPAPVRDHIANLRNFGLSLESIARLAGEHPSSLSTLTQPNNLAYAKTITGERATRILSVRFDIDGIPADSRVNNAGTRRRIEALARNGWSLRHLGDRLGVTPQSVYGYRTRSGLTAANARAIRDLYDELWDQRGPNERVRRHAERLGWASPLAWDDDTIDDPNATPDLGADTPRPSGGNGTPVDVLVENIEWLLRHDSALIAGELAERFGYADRSAIQNALARHGHRDLLERLNRNQERAA